MLKNVRFLDEQYCSLEVRYYCPCDVYTVLLCSIFHQTLTNLDPNHPLTRPTTPGTRGVDTTQGYFHSSVVGKIIS